MGYAPHQSPSGDSFPPKGKPYILPYLKATTIPRFSSVRRNRRMVQIAEFIEYTRREFTMPK